MSRIDALTQKHNFTSEEIVELLAVTDAGDAQRLQKAAFDLASEVVGNSVYYRGIVEFSNICSVNCHYCGIRAGNTELTRYCMSKSEIVECTRWAADNGYASCVLQSGERRDERFVEFVEDCIAGIKSSSKSKSLPEGLGITLSLGEQSLETYARWFAAGAHRYLLRIETSNPSIFARIHPESQSLESRQACLSYLRECGYQVGTGVMIGIPGQTLEDLAADILFFRENDIDMIGMGPYITHPDSPMFDQGMLEKDPLLQLSLNMIAVTRLVLKDVNIASTTALQALVHNGRELGIL